MFDLLIPVANVARLIKALQRLANKAAKLGMPAVAWTLGEVSSRKVIVDVDGRAVERTIPHQAVTVTGEAPQLPGYTLVAAIDHTEGGAVIRTVPGESCPESYRSAGNNCDHCGHNRRRKSTYILRHESGEHKQVGSTCIKDFLGLQFDAMLSAYRWLLTCDGSEFGGAPRGAFNVSLSAFLTLCASSIREFGWRARGAGAAACDRHSRRGYGEPSHSCPDCQIPTADRIWDGLRGFGSLPTVTEADQTAAAEAQAWALALAPSNDYQHNIKTIAACETIKRKQAGFAGSIVSSHQRQGQRDAERQAREAARRKALAEQGEAGANEHQGTVGQPLTVTGAVVFQRQCHTRFGVSYLYKFQAPRGLVVWFASRDQDLGTGDTVTLTGRVKKHDSYRGECQTVLTRCKVQEVKKTA
jgi:hypothetical protein